MHEIESRAQLEAAAASPTPTLIWYSARWCAPCRRINADAVQAAATDAKITFVHCDVDTVSMAVHLHSIDRIPTFILWKQGRELARLNSADTAEIARWIRSHA
jgi:thioredoxin 1